LEEYLKQVWGHLIGRIYGPLTFRLILQPAVATFIAIRAAMKDMRKGHPAYGWALFTDAERRHALLREGWREVAKVFVAAVIIDLIYEIIEFRTIYPGQSLIVAAVLALLPYPLIRGLVNRILSHRFPQPNGRDPAMNRATDLQRDQCSRKD
jgi:hypothetical protein